MSYEPPSPISRAARKSKIAEPRRASLRELEAQRAVLNWPPASVLERMKARDGVESQAASQVTPREIEHPFPEAPAALMGFGLTALGILASLKRGKANELASQFFASWPQLGGQSPGDDPWSLAQHKASAGFEWCAR